MPGRRQQQSRDFWRNNEILRWLPVLQVDLQGRKPQYQASFAPNSIRAYSSHDIQYGIRALWREELQKEFPLHLNELITGL